MSVQFLWRKSIFDNKYRCTQCGHKLIDKDGFPTGTIPDNEENPTMLYCAKCHYNVCKVKNFDDKIMELMGVREQKGKVNHLGSFEEFCVKAEKKLDKIKTKETNLDKELDECRRIKQENEELKLKIKALQERNKTLEDRITKENDKHYKELKKQDAEINRLYKIIENINRG